MQTNAIRHNVREIDTISEAPSALCFTFRLPRGFFQWFQQPLDIHYEDISASRITEHGCPKLTGFGDTVEAGRDTYQ